MLLLGIGVSFYYGWLPAWYGDASRASSSSGPGPAAYPPLPAAAADDLPLADTVVPTPVEAPAPPATPGTARGVDPMPPASAAPPAPAPAAGGATAAEEGSANPTPEPGPLAAVERRAVTELTPRVMALAGLAEALDARMRRYVRACRPESLPVLPPNGSSLDWPVPLMVDLAVAAGPSGRDAAGSDPSGCAGLWNGVKGEADRVADALDELHRFTRSAGLLPGQLRTALAEHRLDGWERYRAR